MKEINFYTDGYTFRASTHNGSYIYATLNGFNQAGEPVILLHKGENVEDALHVNPNERGKGLGKELVNLVARKVGSIYDRPVEMLITTTPTSLSFYLHSFDAHVVEGTGDKGSGIQVKAKFE